MQRSYVTNNHLVSKFNEIGGYFEDGNEVPEYLFIQFVQELGVSNLLIPGIIEDDTLSFDILTSDDELIDVLPLFSDDEAFSEDSEKYTHLRQAMLCEGITPIAAYAYLIFILLYFPCIATIVAIKNETGSWHWAMFAASYTTAVAWIVSALVYQIGSLI